MTLKELIQRRSVSYETKAVIALCSKLDRLAEENSEIIDILLDEIGPQEDVKEVESGGLGSSVGSVG